MNNSKPPSVSAVICETQRSSPSIHFHSKKKKRKENPQKQINSKFLFRPSQDIHIFISLITSLILGRGTYPTCHREYPGQVTRRPDGSSCFLFVLDTQFLLTWFVVSVSVVGTNFLQKLQQLKYGFLLCVWLFIIEPCLSYRGSPSFRNEVIYLFWLVLLWCCGNYCKM